MLIKCLPVVVAPTLSFKDNTRLLQTEDFAWLTSQKAQTEHLVHSSDPWKFNTGLKKEP